MIPVSVKIDMTGFNRGFQLAQQFTRKAPAEACNYAGKEVAFEAYNNTPFVTPQRVDAELNVIMVPKIGVRGRRLKTKTMAVTEPGFQGVPLSVLVIQARANPNSRYNQLTAGRYALPQSPFKGVSREAGRAAMAALVDAMVKNRHRSGHFVASGWLPAIQKLKAALSSRWGGARPPARVQNEGLGDAQPAQSGSTTVACVIENDVGLEGQNAASHNRALMQTTPALQSALDTVGRKEMRYALTKMGKEDLEAPVNKAWA